MNTAGTFILKGSVNETKNMWTQRKLELYIMSNEREALYMFLFSCGKYAVKYIVKY